jgi:cyclic pyranopterin phosphate synthase
MDASQEQIGDAIGAIWKNRNDNYSELRGKVESAKDRVEMSYIGG